MADAVRILCYIFLCSHNAAILSANMGTVLSPCSMNQTHGASIYRIILPEQLTVTAQSYQLDNVSILVIPYQQKITIDVAFQTTFILPA